MKKLIFTALALAAFVGLTGPASASDHGYHCGSHYRSYHGSCSSFGFSFGVPLFYSAPVYSYYPYYSSGYYRSSYPVTRASSAAVDVQVALARRGYYAGDIDGIVGPMTRSAIRRYQATHGLPVTGAMDYPLMRSLRLF